VDDDVDLVGHRRKARGQPGARALEQLEHPDHRMGIGLLVARGEVR
jgi:hypothetical protein